MESEEAGGLSFTHADVEGDASACGICAGPLVGQYFDVGGVWCCERCALTVRDGVGTRAIRFWRALLFGGAAAMISALVWYGIREVTGYEIGLIAIVAGLFVGLAVRKGSYNRGGAGYRALAMMLTYGAIVVTYIPVVASEMLQVSPEENPEESLAEAGAGGVFVAYLIAVPISFLAPFLMLFSGEFIGFFILLIALYEAWKVNGVPRVLVEGPFPVVANPYASGP